VPGLDRGRRLEQSVRVDNPGGPDHAAGTYPRERAGELRQDRRTGSVKGFPGARDIDGRAMLEMPCDVLVPAATQDQITAENAGRIKARVVAEGANSPTTCAADEILDRKGCMVIPDILCNAGGVFVSYLEYTQETQREQWTEAAVNLRLAERMTERLHLVRETAASLRLSLRSAALYLAVKTVCEAVEAHGYLP
jgi:glutamate dehydrogenase (NAD(P)+)